MKKLLIISDLWGYQNCDWLIHYQNLLKRQFEIHWIDCLKLANITSTTQAEIHSQFVNGGIDRVVNRLINNDTDNLLAFSIGGVIAWQLALKSSRNIIAVSSSRLRYETEKPKGNIQLYYGEEDLFKPEKSWFSKMNIIPHIFVNETHECYRKKEIAQIICKQLLDSTF